VSSPTERTPPGPLRRDGDADDVARVLLEPERRFIVASHRNADGDAIGSMLGMARALGEHGRDVVAWHVDPEPVPEELAFMLAPGEEIAARLPEDAAKRTLLALDCASESRLSDRPPLELAREVVNLDHHHDNTRFGHLNLVDARASSTAEIVVHVLEAAGWALSRAVAEPLYVAVVTDTGRFSYSNATPEAHRVAGLMLDAGVEPAAISRRLYENLPLASVRLLGRALARAQPLLDGRLVLSVLTREDFAAAGGDDTEGVVEALRGVRGAEVAALARETGNGGHRVSLRAVGDAVDVSAIAHSMGGGGHRAAAGVTVDLTADGVAEWLRGAVAAQLGSSRA
jgi:phosphoesterase RecJ-like protein